MAFDLRLDGLIGHVVHGCLDFVVCQGGTGTPCGHHAFSPRKAFNRMFVKHFFALRNAGAPVCLVTRFGGASNARSMAQGACFTVDGFAGRIVRNRGR